jgi:integrase
MPSFNVFRRKWKDKDGIERTAKEYSAEIRFKGGARYLRSTGEADRRKAEAAARRIAAEIEANELPKRGKEVLTLERMFARWIVEKGHELRSGKDIKWQIETLMKYIGGAREVADIENETLNGFVVDAKLNGLGPVVINRCLERLRATMNYAGRRWGAIVRVIDWKEFREREPKARKVYLSPEEARRLMDLLPQHIALAFAFSLYTGCRLNEMKTLTWDRIDIDRGVALVITKAQGTEIEMRQLWLSAKAVRILLALPRSGSAFSSQPEDVFDLTNRRKHWEAARKVIGRADIRWHDIRAMTASWARKYAKADNTLIAETLGHSDVETTRRYTRVVDQEVVAMLDQLPDIGGASMAGTLPIKRTINAIDQMAQGK